jgi:dTDP-4-dehydrorhamnose 3,5-epimerase
MIFTETKLGGVLEIGIDPNSDERGFFARSWCQREFDEHGLNPKLVQCSVSFNTHKGTLRGIHYQEAPHAEAKLVRCTQGAIYDVVVDLRPESPTFMNWFAAELSSKNHKSIFVPKGCAHGFLTLEDKTEVFYQMSEFYYPELSRGVRWNDPAFQIVWPAPVEVISDRDRTYPIFEPEQCAR